MRRAATLAAVTGLVVLVAGCTATVGGHPRDTSAPSTSSEVPANQRDEALAARLEPMPSGAVPWQSRWGSTTFPTVEDYLHAMASEKTVRDDIRADLEANGLIDLVHRSWTATDADEIDIVLMRFKDDAGAEGRFLTRRDGLRTHWSALRMGVPGYTADSLVAYLWNERTSGQFVVADVVAHAGDTAVEVYYWSPGELRRGDLDVWVAAQLRLLLTR